MNRNEIETRSAIGRLKAFDVIARPSPANGFKLCPLLGNSSLTLDRSAFPVRVIRG